MTSPVRRDVLPGVHRDRTGAVLDRSRFEPDRFMDLEPNPTAVYFHTLRLGHPRDPEQERHLDGEYLRELLAAAGDLAP